MLAPWTRRSKPGHGPDTPSTIAVSRSAFRLEVCNPRRPRTATGFHRVTPFQLRHRRSQSVPGTFQRAEERADFRLPPPRSAPKRLRTRRPHLADTMAARSWHRSRSAPLLISQSHLYWYCSTVVVVGRAGLTHELRARP